MQYPETNERASFSVAYWQCLPIITPSSTSQSVFTEPFGIITSSFGPFIDVVALEKDKQKFINRIDNLKSQIKPEKSSLDRLKEGGTLDLSTLQEEQNELYEFLFEGDKQPLEKLKNRFRC